MIATVKREDLNYESKQSVGISSPRTNFDEILYVLWFFYSVWECVDV